MFGWGCCPTSPHKWGHSLLSKSRITWSKHGSVLCFERPEILHVCCLLSSMGDKWKMVICESPSMANSSRFSVAMSGIVMSIADAYSMMGGFPIMVFDQYGDRLN